MLLLNGSYTKAPEKPQSLAVKNIHDCYFKIGKYKLYLPLRTK
jgi:hypothetical protein